MNCKKILSMAILLAIIPTGQAFAGADSVTSADQASASTAPAPTLQTAAAPPSTAAPAPPVAGSGSAGQCDPYKDYSCLDAYLGKGFWQRLINDYRLEEGQAAAPSDPKAPPGRRDGWPAAAQSTPPLPFTEWPYGGATSLGVTRPNSVDSPLMTALADTSLGNWFSRNDFQLYGWVSVGGNVSTNSTKPGGNAPAAYDYTPDTIQLDQAVLYLDRFPDTVQTDHVDWGLRLSMLYGVDYRYTTAYGLASYQLLDENKVNGYDFPMLYGELFIPQVADGLMLRFGRFISIPDIEAQLAPNNYMYTHSMTYSFDNYTNTGLEGTVALNKNWTVGVGLTAGTEAWPTHLSESWVNPYPNVPGTGPGDIGYNPLYPGATFKKDPGSMPSVSLLIRYVSDDGKTDFMPVADAINSGRYGYNNLQWYGFTYYHTFDAHWHISSEAYKTFENDVPNALNSDVQTIYANGGAPFSSRFIQFNAPDMAICANAVELTCTASTLATVTYLNYSPDPLNNFSFRPEYFWDREGQRTGVKSRYVAFALGWQHWLSPQIEMRPEIATYHSLDGPAFNGNSNAGIAPDKSHETIASGDIIFHF